MQDEFRTYIKFYWVKKIKKGTINKLNKHSQLKNK